jgi:hypothetical protein
LSLEGNGDAEVFLQTESDEGLPALSPNGRFVAYASDESGKDQVYVKPFPEGPGKWQVSVEHGSRPYWNPAGDRLYYNSYGSLMEVQVSTDPVLRLGTPRLFIDPDQTTLQPWRGTAIARDGKRFIGIRDVEKDEADKVEEGIHVVLNWFSDFE